MVEPIGFIALMAGPDGKPQVTVLHPENFYLVVAKEDMPREWAALCNQYETGGEVEVLGLLMSGEEKV